MMATAQKRSRTTRSPRRRSLRSERLRLFDPDLVSLVRADIVAAHGKPQPAEQSIKDFVGQFFDDIHALRLKQVPWSAIFERLQKYSDCSSRTLQSYYNVLAAERGVIPVGPRRGRRPKTS